MPALTELATRTVEFGSNETLLVEKEGLDTGRMEGEGGEGVAGAGENAPFTGGGAIYRC